VGIVVTKQIIDVSVADATTGWTGTSGQLDTESFKQGTGAFTYQTGKNGTGNGIFTPAVSIDMTANYTTPHLYWTMRCDVFPFTELLNTGATNSGLMLKVTDDVGEFVQWHVAGSDTWDGSWKNFIFDLTNTANIHSTSVGTLTLSAVESIEWITDNSNSGTIRIIDNTWLDAVRYGEGLLATSVALDPASTTFNFQDIADVDKLTANYYGVIQETDGVLFVQGTLQIGKDNAFDGPVTNFLSESETLVFLDRVISDTHHALIFESSGLLFSESNVSGLVCKTVGTTGAELKDVTGGAMSLSIDSSTFINMGDVSFTNGSTLVESSRFENCGLFTLTNSVMRTSTMAGCDTATLVSFGGLVECTVIGSVGTVAALSVTDLTKVNACAFTSDNTIHAVELTSIADSPMVWNSTYEAGSYAAADGSVGNEAIYVNVISGSLTINVSAGATTPSIRTAGAVVTVVVNPVTLKLVIKDTDNNLITTSDVNVLVEAAAGGPLAVGTDIIKAFSDANGEAQDTRTYTADQPIVGWARKSSGAPYYKQSSISGTIDSANGLTLTILMISDE